MHEFVHSSLWLHATSLYSIQSWFSTFQNKNSCREAKVFQVHINLVQSTNFNKFLYQHWNIIMFRLVDIWYFTSSINFHLIAEDMSTGSGSVCCPVCRNELSDGPRLDKNKFHHHLVTDHGYLRCEQCPVVVYVEPSQLESHNQRYFTSKSYQLNLSITKQSIQWLI